MASLVPALLSVLLAALYFIGVDTSKDIEMARNGALLALALWSLAAALRTKKPAVALSPSATTPASAPVKVEAAPLAAVSAPAVAPASSPAPVKAAPVRDGRDVLSFLGLLQEKGRLLDFLMDDISRYGDAQIGAAARVVHQGAGTAVREYFDIKPVATGAEGDRITLSNDYDPHSYRLIGRVLGEPPYRGHVLHRGWLTTSIKLPELRPVDGGMPIHQNIITPAEVELT